MPAVPATTDLLVRYAAYLGRTKAFSTIQQYLNIIRLLHMEMGLTNPLKDNWMLQSVLRGIKRGKGAGASYKLPINPEDLLRIHGLLNLQQAEDGQFWAAILCCFYGLLRISNVTTNSMYNKANNSNQLALKRGDFSVSSKGIVLNIKRTKTIQCQERVLQVPLPYLGNHPLCPASALLSFLRLAGPLPHDLPLFSYSNSGNIHTLTQEQVRTKLQRLLTVVGLPASQYGTHSLRRGGATWLILCGVPLSVVKALGDWKSDCVTKYIKPDTASRLDILNKVASEHLPKQS